MARLQPDHLDKELIWERTCFPYISNSCDMPVRHLGSGDAALLPTLAYAAFAGTVDGAPLEQWARKISAILSNGYGTLLADASFVAELPSGQLAGVVLASDFTLYGAPVIAMIAVSPAVQHKGLGTLLLRRSIGALAANGVPSCCAKISQGNEASRRLFIGTGFARRS